MDKVLVTAPQQIVNILFEACDSVEECEQTLGIHFAYEADFTVFAADYAFPCKDEDPYDGCPVNKEVWRRNEDCILPENYPVVMVYRITNEFDRMGDVKIRLFEFVALDDFKAAQ